MKKLTILMSGLLLSLSLLSAQVEYYGVRGTTFRMPGPTIVPACTVMLCPQSQQGPQPRTTSNSMGYFEIDLRDYEDAKSGYYHLWGWIWIRGEEGDILWKEIYWLIYLDKEGEELLLHNIELVEWPPDKKDVELNIELMKEKTEIDCLTE